MIRDLTKSFDGKVLFDHVNYEFQQGKIYGLLGRNGAGKTTLFNCVAKNIQIDSGKILLSTNSNERDYDNTEIGFTYTQPQLPAFMTAFEFVRFFMDINKHRIKDHKTPQEHLDQVGIAREDQHRLLKDFSHGMQNKVQMLVSLMVLPPVMLLDEPLTSFDVVAAHEIKQLIREAKKDSVVIFSTHILQLAQDLCDEIVLLHNQKLTGIDPARIHDKDFEDEVVQLLSTQEEQVISQTIISHGALTEESVPSQKHREEAE
ncbi:ATP-binding cassette domain-containing protein [Enterococcus sp. DIV0876]|uniref:ABC transporter ATP-binding protein n=1 Tax=Enterococcus sp. DIV0876 TaxID=2774633 RepID=UPI003D300037